MADFCAQCSKEIFGEDSGDLAGISKLNDEAKGLYPIVLCEGCGPIMVDHAGNCISSDCLKNHGSLN